MNSSSLDADDFSEKTFYNDQSGTDYLVVYMPSPDCVAV
jgi:hypothetical protein